MGGYTGSGCRLVDIDERVEFADEFAAVVIEAAFAVIFEDDGQWGVFEFDEGVAEAADGDIALISGDEAGFDELLELFDDFADVVVHGVLEEIGPPCAVMVGRQGGTDQSFESS